MKCIIINYDCRQLESWKRTAKACAGSTQQRKDYSCFTGNLLLEGLENRCFVIQKEIWIWVNDMQIVVQLLCVA